MSYTVKQSSTEAALLFFLTLTSDHLSPATGLSPTVTLSKNGAAFASPSGAVSEIANGWYKVAANATDTNTLGPLALHASVATADNCDLVVANVVAYDPQATDMGLTETAEAYASKTGQSKLASLLRLVLQTLLSSTWTPASTTGTLTVLKQDGTTTAATSAGNDPVNPTSVVRAT